MEKISPFISVIIPVYNAEKYIDECMETVLNQTLTNIEVILVNDGSKDSSQKILENFQESDDRIVVINQENQGSGPARNNGLKIAQGKYIAFMDPDDWYPDENVLKTLYETAEKNEALICGGALEACIDGKKSKEFDNSAKFTFKKEGFILYKDYQFDHGYTRFIYNREFLKDNDICFPDYRRYQDPPFMVKAMIVAEKFYAIESVTYCYRMDYSKTKFDSIKLKGLLSGIRDIIEISTKYNLDELFETTVKRIDFILEPEIYAIISLDNIDLIQLIMEIDLLVYKYSNHHIEPLVKLSTYCTSMYRYKLFMFKVRLFMLHPIRSINSRMKKIIKICRRKFE